jgi:hypothetical protein
VKRIFKDMLTYIKRVLIEYTKESDGEGLESRMDELLRGYKMLHGLTVTVSDAVQVSENEAATTEVAESDVRDETAINGVVDVSAALLQLTKLQPLQPITMAHLLLAASRDGYATLIL